MKFVSFSVLLLQFTLFMFSCDTNGGSGIEYFDTKFQNGESITSNAKCDVQGIKNVNNSSDNILKDKVSNINHTLFRRLTGKVGVVGEFYHKSWVSSQSSDSIDYEFFEDGTYTYESVHCDITDSGPSPYQESKRRGTWYIYGKDGLFYFLTLKLDDSIKTYEIQVSDSYLYFYSTTDMSVDGFLDGTNNYITIFYESQYGDCPKKRIVKKSHIVEEADLPIFSEDVLYNQYQLFQGWYTNENVQVNAGMVLNDDIVFISKWKPVSSVNVKAIKKMSEANVGDVLLINNTVVPYGNFDTDFMSYKGVVVCKNEEKLFYVYSGIVYTKADSPTLSVCNQIFPNLSVINNALNALEKKQISKSWYEVAYTGSAVGMYFSLKDGSYVVARYVNDVPTTAPLHMGVGFVKQ